MNEPELDLCCGCGGAFEVIDGPVHAYMTSSPGCFAAFNELLAAEYSDVLLQKVHRLTVDAYAVQHPGSPDDRRCVQSVGLHLARLFVQLEHPMTPQRTNEVMGDFAKDKASLIYLKPPAQFRLTVAHAAPFAGSSEHDAKVRAWAEAAWHDWSAHHDYVKDWVRQRVDL